MREELHSRLVGQVQRGSSASSARLCYPWCHTMIDLSSAGLCINIKNTLSGAVTSPVLLSSRTTALEMSCKKPAFILIIIYNEKSKLFLKVSLLI